MSLPHEMEAAGEITTNYRVQLDAMTSLGFHQVRSGNPPGELRTPCQTRMELRC